jgi:hypothetical protein
LFLNCTISDCAVARSHFRCQLVKGEFLVHYLYYTTLNANFLDILVERTKETQLRDGLLIINF